jgi:hypothetical protein
VSAVFDDLLSVVERDPRVVAVVLGGSRGKGTASARSDWDVYVIASDGSDVADLFALFSSADDRVELCGVLTLSEFATYAAVGSADEWNRYTFAHVEPVFDRTDGVVSGLCAAKEWLPDELAAERAALRLDAYCNLHYRAIKSIHNHDDPLAGQLDAAESVGQLLEFVFAVERRVRPYNKFLAWELERHPLQTAWLPSSRAAELLVRITSGDAAAAVTTFERVERYARQSGLAVVLDAWPEAALAEMRRRPD